MAADTIPSRLLHQARVRPDQPAYHVRSNGTWQATNWRTYAGQVRQAGRALATLGVDPGGCVSILGFNRPEWIIADVGAMSIGGAPAGIYTTCSPPEVAYIIRHSESPVVFVENLEQWKKVEAELATLPLLRWVVTMQGTPKIDHPKVLSWDDFMAKASGTEDKLFDRRVEELKPDQLATLIYTSGTTGPPKGVMLSHQNLAWTAGITRELIGVTATDSALSYLPLSHIAEQMFSIHGPLSHGYPIYFAESIDKVPENLKEVQPTVFFGVPRIWEKFQAGVAGKLKDASGVKKKLVDWAMSVGRQANALKNRGKEPSGALAFQYRLANKLVFSKLKPAIGLGRARMCVSGAAPIAPEVIDFFMALDVVILEVYGQSEGSGPTSFNVPGKVKIGTVGLPLPGVEVKLGPDGEILVKGPNVFLGYYKEPEATAETLIDGGWLASGDLGEFDADGFLKITGRKKEIIITAGGKNVAPKNIEAALKNSELVNEAVVIGDRRKYLTALLTLEPEHAAKFAAAQGIPIDQIHEHPKVLAEIQKIVDGVNEGFARVEGIKKFKVLPRNFTIENGELTPTLKVKRKIVNKNWGNEIEAMYVE
jgi:long-chain acyl-CoA synthetase